MPGLGNKKKKQKQSGQSQDSAGTVRSGLGWASWASTGKSAGHAPPSHAHAGQEPARAKPGQTSRDQGPSEPSGPARARDSSAENQQCQATVKPARTNLDKPDPVPSTRQGSATPERASFEQTTFERHLFSDCQSNRLTF